MDARKVAAEFTAYAWYEECRAGRQCREEAAQFARENWSVFLPVAQEGWGRLLIRVASKRPPHRRTRRRPSSLAAAG
jgi:hypothetical protein